MRGDPTQEGSMQKHLAFLAAAVIASLTAESIAASGPK
jgi:hypothetical protein